MNEYEAITLDEYFDFVMNAGLLLSLEHAERWSTGVLKTLGTALNRRTKKALAKALPEELADSLNGVFWLIHFRDPNQTAEEFCGRVARRSGNSNGEFAVHPTVAVFAGVKNLVDEELIDRVAQNLSPQVRNLWEQAEYTPIKL
jgi:uncharacterized protein (DUF2267 family)